MANAAKIVLTEGDAPASPSAGTTSIYFKTDHVLYKKDHDGTETAFASFDPASPGEIGGTTASTAHFTTIATPEVTSAAAINLAATTDVTIPANVGITFGAGEKIEGDDTDLTVTSGGAINLTATTDVVIPANVGITFGTGEKIEGDNTDLTITSGAKINLTATSDVIVPVNVGVVFGDGGEKIESDNTDFTITSGGLLKLVSTGTQGAIHPAPAADTYTGFAITLEAHEDTVIGSLCYIDASGEAALTDADAAATMPGCVLATAIVDQSVDPTGVFLLPGGVIHLHTLAPAWTIGGLVYAGSGAGPHTAGALNQALPTGDSDVVQIVGVALAADILLFIPSLVTVEAHA
jgi:hypothetical protein